MQDLIRVAGVPKGSQQYIEEVIAFFRRVYEDSVPEFKPDRVSYGSDGTPCLPFDQAAMIMVQQLSVYKRFAPGVG